MILIKVDGTKQSIPLPKNGRDYSFEELRPHIGGGYIEMVSINKDYWMLVDEDGLAKGLPRNEEASRLYFEMAVRNGHPPLTIHANIVGDVVLVSRSQIL